MKSFVLFFLAFLVSHLAPAQQQQVLGDVYLQNSGKQPVSGVEIYAEGSNGGHSKDDGSYQLDFQDIKKGAPFQVEISDEDGSGKKILLTNKSDTRQFRIPDDPSDRFILIVADSLEYENRKAVYVKEILRFKQVELEKIRAELVEKSQKEKQDAAEKKRLFDQIQELENNIGRKNRELQNKAEYISLINLDDVPKVVKMAIKEMETANNIDEVLVILNRDRLFQQQKKWQTKIRKDRDSLPEYNRALEAIHDAYGLRKELLLSVNRFSDAVLCLEDQIFIRENNLIDSLELTGHYDEIAGLLNKMGRYREAKVYALEIKQFVKGNQDLEWYDIFADIKLNDIEYDLSGKRDFDTYLDNYESSMNRMKSLIVNPNWKYSQYFEDKDTSVLTMFIGTMTEMGRLFAGNPSFDDICNFYQPLFDRFSNSDENQVLSLYKDFFCQSAPNLDIAKKVNEKLLDIEGTSEKELESKLNLYQILRIIYLVEGEYEMLLESIEKAIELREQFSNSDDVYDLVELYLSYANNYLYSARGFMFAILPEEDYLPRAINYWEKALEIQRTQLNSSHFDLADTYYQYANFKFEFEEDEEAYSLVYKSINIKRSHLPELSYELNNDYDLLKNICLQLGRFDEYEKTLAQQIEINAIYEAPYNSELYNLHDEQVVYALKRGQYNKAMSSFLQLKSILNFHDKNNMNEIPKEDLSELLEDAKARYVEILIRSGELKAGKKAWKKYQKVNRKDYLFQSKVNVHIALLEKDNIKIYDLIAGNEYLTFQDHLQAFPESLPLLEEFRKSKVYKALDDLNNPK